MLKINSLSLGPNAVGGTEQSRAGGGVGLGLWGKVRCPLGSPSSVCPVSHHAAVPQSLPLFVCSVLKG